MFVRAPYLLAVCCCVLCAIDCMLLGWLLCAVCTLPCVLVLAVVCWLAIMRCRLLSANRLWLFDVCGWLSNVRGVAFVCVNY